MRTPKWLPSFVILLILVLFAAGPGAADKSPARSARDILDQVDDLFRGDSSYGRATMSVTTRNWERSLTLEFWNRGKEESLIRILAPRKEKGTATLKSGTDLWNYLPKVNRVIKLPSSMMSASWMGSHFTNDDLVKESRMTEDYDFEITFDGERDGEHRIEITCVPHPEAAVVWGKVVVVVEADSGIPRRVDYYDEDLEVTRTLTYSEIRELGGRRLPTRLEIVPVDPPGESTKIVYEEIRFDEPVSDDTFSLRALQG